MDGCVYKGEGVQHQRAQKEGEHTHELGNGNTGTRVHVQLPIINTHTQVQQQFTQRGGRRPFGLSTLIVGFDELGKPCLYQTDPSGTYSSWRANAIGRNGKTVREYLEKHYFPKEKKSGEEKDNDKDSKDKDGGDKDEVKGVDDSVEVKMTEQQTIKLAVQALLEVVESGAKNIDIAVMRQGRQHEMVKAEVIEKLVEELNAEAEAKKKAKSDNE